MPSVKLRRADLSFSWTATLQGTNKWEEVVQADEQEASQISLDPGILCELINPDTDEQDPNNSKPCEVIVRAVGSWRLKSFSAVCDARRVEVYADSDFCGTAKGEVEKLTDDVPETTNGNTRDSLKVATFLVTFPDQEEGCMECRLRFVSLSSPWRVRLFCLTFLVVEVSGEAVKPSTANSTGIDLSSVERWLGKLNTPNNTRAQGLMESVRRFQSSQASAATDLRELADHHGGSIPGLAGLLQLMPQVSQQAGHQSGLAMTSVAGHAVWQELMPVIQAVRQSREKEQHKAALNSDAISPSTADSSLNAQPPAGDHGNDSLRELEQRLLTHIDHRLDAMQQFMEERFDRLEMVVNSCLSAFSSVSKYSSQQQPAGSHGGTMLMQGLAGLMQQLQTSTHPSNHQTSAEMPQQKKERTCES